LRVSSITKRIAASGALKAAARPAAAPAASRPRSSASGELHAFRHGLGDRRPHVNGGTLATGDETGRERQNAAYEFHRQHPPPAHVAQSLHRAFDFLDAAAGRFRRNATREEKRRDQGDGGNPRRCDDGQGARTETLDQPGRPVNQRIDDEMEGGTHDAGGQAAQGRQEIQGAIGDRLLWRSIS
jgi:hypothetical protein